MKTALFQLLVFCQSQGWGVGLDIGQWMGWPGVFWSGSIGKLLCVSIHLQEPRAEVMETHTHTHSPVLIISDRRLAVASDNRAVSSSSFILLPHFAWLTCWLFRMDTYCLPLNWLSWLHRWSTLTRFIIYKLISMLADYIYNLSCWQVFEVGK